jgi:hypothetical protein
MRLNPALNSAFGYVATARMFFPMMILIAVISFGQGFGTSWQETFIQGRFGFVEKIIQGRNLLFVTAYYILWAFVAWKWPLRIANNQ